jgi:hypothetical protein
VDVPQLESALLNLVINARDAMAGSGRLTIETANAELDQAYADAHAEVISGQYVMMAVTDTGHGMTAEIMARAFDPFFTTKGSGEGTGLGLSQVHGFLKQSRGHIKLYSEQGKGTTDVVLASGNGRELADALVQENPDLIVLYMTGYTRNAIVHNGILDPGVRLLSKPFTIEDLNRELRAAMTARKLGGN